MARVNWLPEAVVNFERLYYFLLDKDFDAANKTASNIIHGAKLLETSPHIGRPMLDDRDRRELFVAFGAGAYVIRYIFKNDTVYILKVWHSRENRN